VEFICSRQANGKIDYVKITSRAGEMCHLPNPWPGKAVQLTRNGRKAETLAGERLTFQTAPEEPFELRPE